MITEKQILEQFERTFRVIIDEESVRFHWKQLHLDNHMRWQYHPEYKQVEVFADPDILTDFFQPEGRRTTSQLPKYSALAMPLPEPYSGHILLPGNPSFIQTDRFPEHDYIPKYAPEHSEVAWEDSLVDILFPSGIRVLLTPNQLYINDRVAFSWDKNNVFVSTNIEAIEVFLDNYQDRHPDKLYMPFPLKVKVPGSDDYALSKGVIEIPVSSAKVSMESFPPTRVGPPLYGNMHYEPLIGGGIASG